MSVMARVRQLQSQHLTGEEQAVKQLRQLRDDLRAGTDRCSAIMQPLILSAGGFEHEMRSYQTMRNRAFDVKLAIVCSE